MKGKKLVSVVVLAVVLVLAVSFLLLNYIPLKSGEVRFIAHRGLSSQYYDNTVQAFEGAGKSDFFYGIETDVRVTADGHFVCAHDNDQFQDRAKKIDEITLAEALVLPLKNPEYKIATFEGYLDICKQYGKVAFIEIKPTLDMDTMERLIDVVKDKGMLSDSVFISFHPANIFLIRLIDSDARVQLLTSDAGMILPKVDVGVKYTILRKKHIKEAHNNGNEVNVWTVNNRLTARWFMSLGVDYITTDYIL